MAAPRRDVVGHRHRARPLQANHTGDRQGKASIQCSRGGDQNQHDSGEGQRLLHFHLSAQSARDEQDRRHPRSAQRSGRCTGDERVTPDDEQTWREQETRTRPAPKEPR